MPGNVEYFPRVPLRRGCWDQSVVEINESVGQLSRDVKEITREHDRTNQQLLDHITFCEEREQADLAWRQKFELEMHDKFARLNTAVSEIMKKVNKHSAIFGVIGVPVAGTIAYLIPKFIDFMLGR